MGEGARQVSVSKAQRAKANAIERQVEVLSVARLPRIVRQSMRMKTGVLAAFRRGEPIDHIIREFSAELGMILTDVTVATHLAGRMNVLVDASEAIKRRRKRIKALDKITDAVTFLRDRTALTELQLQHLRITYSESALDIARGFDETVGARLRKEVAISITEGETVKDGSARLGRAFNSMGINDVRPHLLETIFRTQTRISWSAGEWNADQDPAIQEILWGYTYSTVGDDRVRPSHALLDGTTLPKDDPIWDTIMTPNGWECRCQILRVYDTDAHVVQAVGDPEEIDGVLVTPGPDEGFEFNPGRLHQDTIAVPRIDRDDVPGIAASISLPKEVLALACLIDDPTMLDEQIASRVGCSRRSLYNWPRFKAAKKAMGSGRFDRTRGSKFDGELEAWR